MYRVLGGEERWNRAGKIFEERMAENSPNLAKDSDLEIQELSRPQQDE